MAFPKGNQFGNRKGRPQKPEVEELRVALDKAKKKHGRSFLDHFVDRAYEDDPCAIALAKKIVPDKIIDESFGRQIIVELRQKLADKNANSNGK